MIENYLKKMHSKSCNIQEEINDVLKIFDEIKSSELALSSLQQSMQDEVNNNNFSLCTRNFISIYNAVYISETNKVESRL